MLFRSQRAAFGTLAKRPVDPEVLDSYALPAATNGGSPPQGWPNDGGGMRRRTSVVQGVDLAAVAFHDHLAA